MIEDYKRIYESSQNFIYICMTCLVIYGIFLVFNTTIIVYEMGWYYLARWLEWVEDINFRV